LLWQAFSLLKKVTCDGNYLLNVWYYKNELPKEDIINRLFEKLHSQLLTDGMIINKGSLVSISPGKAIPTSSEFSGPFIN